MKNVINGHICSIFNSLYKRNTVVALTHTVYSPETIFTFFSQAGKICFSNLLLLMTVQVSWDRGKQLPPLREADHNQPSWAVWRNISHPSVSLIPTVLAVLRPVCDLSLLIQFLGICKHYNYLLAQGETAHGSTPAEPRVTRLHEMQWGHVWSETMAVQGCWWGGTRMLMGR